MLILLVIERETLRVLVIDTVCERDTLTDGELATPCDTLFVIVAVI